MEHLLSFLNQLKSFFSVDGSQRLHTLRSDLVFYSGRRRQVVEVSALRLFYFYFLFVSRLSAHALCEISQKQDGGQNTSLLVGVDVSL